jgi:ABC-type Fe3+/spermidine/putrescine transport system ATPase subunit
VKYLDIEALRLSRGDFDLRLSLSLDRGQTGVIVGPSGCGKTSLLRCIAGLEHPQEGRISVNGIDISNLAPEKRNLGFVFQDLALFDHLDGRGNLEFGLKLAGVDKARRRKVCETLAKTLRITPLLDRKPATMSGGEKQRLAFARALATKPGILLLDEPLSSLDAPLRKELRRYLRTMLQQESITALHVTHDVDEALDLGDRLFIMNKGRLVAEGSPSEILANPPDAWCVNFLSLGLLLLLDRQPSFKPQPIYNSTPYGKFSSPGKVSLPKDDNALENVFYFIPPRAIIDASTQKFASVQADGERDFLAGKVESITERNGLCHIRLSLTRNAKENEAEKVLEPNAAANISMSALVGEAPFIEFDTQARPNLVKGAPGYLKIAPEACALLPGLAPPTSAI